ncbi:hypothetical protein HK098_002433 [Nowakowskiella sp. JEL0407]|nr:hypothetical protein HK098_002433 [Nowakowskiella sp. JEL0407]
MNQNIHACISSLKSELGDSVSSNRNDLKPYVKSLSYHVPPFADAVVIAKSENDISKALRICNSFRVPVIPFAAGSSLEGHTVPDTSILKTRGTVMLDVSNMDRVLEINQDDLSCIVEPGVNWVELNETLVELGLFFSPDPGAAAMVGGMCGTNCSGSLAYRYGTMKDNVLGLRVVLADGRIINTRRGSVTKSSAGYDLTRLIVGSEGTLGIVSKAILRLRKIPKISAVAMVQFKSLRETCNFVQNIARIGTDGAIRRIEMIEKLCVQAFNNTKPSWGGFDEAHTILVELCGESHDYVAFYSDICEKYAREDNCTFYKFSAKSQEECERFWAVRKRAHFAVKTLRPGNPNISTLSTDAAVPVSKFFEIMEYTQKMVEKFKVIAPIVAHAGNGNFHAITLVDITNPEELATVELFRHEISAKAIELGGTCTGEHGVGIGKRELLVEELGKDAIDVMHSIKSAIDPNHILNPGKVFKLKANL